MTTLKNGKNERRKYERFDTEIKIYFRVTYDIQTIVKFQVVDKQKDQASSRKYSALSKNVSVEGLAFVSGKELQKGDRLYLEVYLPGQKDPVEMNGEVCWSKVLPSGAKNKRQFETGVQLITVDGKSVAGTIHYDEAYKIVWSAALESILGNFRIFMQKKRVR